MANIRSQIKRNRQNETRRQRNQAVRSELKTRAKNALAAAETGDGFHGRGGRPWTAVPGNLHLAALVPIAVPAREGAGALRTVPVLALLDESCFERARTIAQTVQVLDLSAHPDFQNTFINSLISARNNNQAFVHGELFCFFL